MELSAQEVFDALADPTRRAILGLLAEHDEMAVGEIAAGIGSVGRTAVSSQLRILRKSGLVAERRDGRYRYISLQPDGPVRDAMSFLQGILRSGIPSMTNSVAVTPSNDQEISDTDAYGDIRTA